MANVIEIDGSVLEGGGQILRLAMSFSTLLRQPIKITNIRAGRSRSGLRPQHLKGIELARDMCGGTLEGAAIDSTEVTFTPNALKSGNFLADTKTAGSVGLLIQVALPIALFSPSNVRLSLKGGTNAEMAPPIDHTMNAFLKTLRKFGGNFECSVVRRGYFPKGGGEVEIEVTPVQTLKPVNLIDRGTLTHIRGRAYVAGTLPMALAYKMKDVAFHMLKEFVSCDVTLNIEAVKESPREAFGNGSGIVLFAETSNGCVLGASALGSRDKNGTEVGSDAASELIKCLQSKSCVDLHVQDQIIILMALADGKSVVNIGSVTQHTQTAIYIAEKLTKAKFSIKTSSESNSEILECDGIGFKNEYL